MANRSIWNNHEVELLQKLYPNPRVSTIDLKRAFPDKTLKDVQTKASSLGIKRSKKEMVVICSRCGSCFERYSGIIYCNSCGKKLRLQIRSETGSHVKRKPKPYATAIPVEERIASSMDGES